MSPCRYCQDRYTKCHSECTKYIEFRKRRDDLLQTKHEQNALKYGAFRRAQDFNHHFKLSKIKPNLDK